MNKKLKLGLLATSLMAGAASIVPLTAYAATTDSKTLTVTVSPTISLDPISNVSITADSTQVETATLAAKVIANKGYSISISASHAALTSSDTADTIPAVAPVAGANGWGIKAKKADNSADDADNYSVLSTTPAVFYKATSGTVAAGATTNFTVGVSIAPTLTAASYSTELTVTAATN